MVVRASRISQSWRGEWRCSSTVLFSWYDNYTFEGQLIRIRFNEIS